MHEPGFFSVVLFAHLQGDAQHRAAALDRLLGRCLGRQQRRLDRDRLGFHNDRGRNGGGRSVKAERSAHFVLGESGAHVKTLIGLKDALIGCYADDGKLIQCAVTK